LFAAPKEEIKMTKCKGTRLIAFFLLLQWCSTVADAQQLLANGGLEDENSCMEYSIHCAPEAWVCTASSFNYYFKQAALAHGGYHFMALLAGHTNSAYKRTFIRSRLLCGLRKNAQYQLRFFIQSPHQLLDSAGVYFSSQDFLFEKRAYQKIEPSVYLADAVKPPAQNNTGWQEIIITYRANGEENFITLGYFGKNDPRGGTGIPMENNFLLLVDDISMQPLDPNEQLCSGWRSNKDSIYLENERHEYLDRLIRYYRNKPPVLTHWASTRLPVTDTLLIPDILFASGSAVLNGSSFPVLDSFCRALRQQKVDSLVVNGHTDSVGTMAYNMKLSAGRAAAVLGYIRQQTGISEALSRLYFFGYTRPVAGNRESAGRQQNRRVEILLYRQE
jgi:outer membrane protein OmpA-like peptidoglycan-associated protein